MINKERLSQMFKFLVEIDSPSREEGHICAELRQLLESIGATTMLDNSAPMTGSDTGNLIAKFPGTTDVPSIFLGAHMDTVEPGRGIKAVLKDGIFTSEGDTILGADDKSAIAIIFEVLWVLKENNLPHGPLELILTTCEEVGLVGAKHLDYSLIDSSFGYIMDSTDVEGIVTRAPAASRFDVKIFGKAAHAGAEPENGIDAISIASKAISTLTLGRIDAETTCNIGTFNAGTATNIVPDLVEISGEARSHNPEKLKEVTNHILSAFEKSVAEAHAKTEGSLPRLEISVEDDFPNTNIPEDHRVVTLAKEAAAAIDKSMTCKTIGGGADANVFFSKGLMAGVIGTGMREIHTVNEWIAVEDMVETTKLLLEIINIHAAGEGN